MHQERGTSTVLMLTLRDTGRFVVSHTTVPMPITGNNDRLCRNETSRTRVNSVF